MFNKNLTAQYYLSRRFFGDVALFSAIMVLLANFIAAPVVADEFEWTNPISNFYADPNSWTQLSGTGPAPPGPGDTAIFNEADPDTYTVTLPNNPTHEDLFIYDGSVRFHRASLTTYTLTNNAILQGGHLKVGGFGDPLNMSVANNFLIGGGSISRLDVLNGSVIDVLGQLRIGEGTDQAFAVLDGPDTMLTTSPENATIIGGTLNDVEFFLRNSATAVIGGDLDIANSTGTDVLVNVDAGAEMTVGGDINLISIADTNQLGSLGVLSGGTINANGNLNIGTGGGTFLSHNSRASLYVGFSGAVFTQLGEGSIDIGGAATDDTRGEILVFGGGTITSGTGAITIHPTGVLNLGTLISTGGPTGSFIANGPVTLENGGTFAIDMQFDFDAKMGFDNSAGGTIDFSGGTLTISGGTFQASEDIDAGDFKIEGVDLGDRPTLIVSNGATTIVNRDLFIGGSATGAGAGTGQLDLLSGRAEVDGTIKLWGPGEITMRGSDSTFLSAGVIDHTDGGNFNFELGTLQTGTFMGDLVNLGGKLAPGPNAGPIFIMGTYTQQTGSTLDMEIGGTSPGGTYDVVSVTGVATIDGQLQLSLINGFVPAPDDEFVLLAATSLVGFFDNIFSGQRLDVAGGQGSFVVNYGVGSAFPSNQIVLSDFMSAGPVVVTPNSFMVTRGELVIGDETNLVGSDNSDLTLVRSGTDIQSRTEFEVKSTSPVASPTSFEFTLEGTVFARSNVVQTIELFDYVAAAWVTVDTRNAARAPTPDLLVTVAATGDLSRFVEAGTMCIEARVRYKSDSPRQQFASNTDQTIWTIE